MSENWSQISHQYFSRKFSETDIFAFRICVVARSYLRKKKILLVICILTQKKYQPKQQTIFHPDQNNLSGYRVQNVSHASIFVISQF